MASEPSAGDYPFANPNQRGLSRSIANYCQRHQTNISVLTEVLGDSVGFRVSVVKFIVGKYSPPRHGDFTETRRSDVHDTFG